MTERVWKSGPPPHVGWWNASVTRDSAAWRWWNGERWSIVHYAFDRPGSRPSKASEGMNRRMLWTDYWPENARVPRLDPKGGHWTFNDGTKPRDAPSEIVYVSRLGNVHRGSPHGLRWSNADDLGGDIIAWRPAA